MADDLNLQARREGSAVVVVLKGRLDGNTSAPFSEFLGTQVGDDDHSVALDVSALSYLSSAGLRELLKLAKRVNAHRRRPAIAGAQPTVSTVLEIAGFASLFHCTPDVPSALKQLEKDGDGSSGKGGLLGRLFASGSAK